MKSIIVFSDGTGNSAGSPHKTNVWRLYKTLEVAPGSDQITYYDDGVGTSSFPLFRFFGLIFGFGLATNVKAIYSFVCRSYEQGDRIYGFGFSRGAFTMRVVMELISEVGLVNPHNIDEREFQKRVNRAYKTFRAKAFKPSVFSLLPSIINKFRNVTPLSDGDFFWPKIEMLGVWDTVDAYGLPIDEMRTAWDLAIYPLAGRDRNCSSSVLNAYHALAIDEQRLSFSPILWNEADEDPATSDKNRITQVWFPGVHADLGGGYPNDSLALVSLNWMINCANSHGLEFDKNKVDAYKNSTDINGPMHDSRGGIGFLYRFEPRNIDVLCRDSISTFTQRLADRLAGRFTPGDEVNNTVHIETPKLHYSVFERIKQKSNDYAPINLPARYVVVDDDNHIVNEGSLPIDNAERRQAQGRLWNIVAIRKLIYICNAMLACLFVFILVKKYGIDVPEGEELAKRSLSLIKNDRSAAFIAGTFVGFLYLGGRFKSALHHKIKDIWRGRTGKDKALQGAGKAIYDDRIVSGDLVRSPVSRVISWFRGCAELALIALFIFSAFGLVFVGLKYLSTVYIIILFMLILPILIFWGITKLVDL